AARAHAQALKFGAEFSIARAAARLESILNPRVSTSQPPEDQCPCRALLISSAQSWHLLPHEFDLPRERCGEADARYFADAVLIAVAQITRVPELARERALAHLETSFEALVGIVDTIVSIPIVPAVQDELDEPSHPSKELQAFIVAGG